MGNFDKSPEPAAGSEFHNTSGQVVHSISSFLNNAVLGFTKNMQFVTTFTR